MLRKCAPKADALPGCATPRPAKTLRFLASEPLADSPARGNLWQNAARTGGISPDYLPNRHAMVSLLRKVKPLERDHDNWFDEHMRHATGLPLSLAPFWLRQQRDDDSMPSGIWNVCCATRKSDEFVLIADCSDVFAAYHSMVDAFDAWQDIRPVERIYFIGTKLERGQLVKVGFSRDPEARLRALQTSHGERLQIFATTPGSKFDEQKYHRRWRARRRQGEWFTIGDCIINEIDRLASTARTTGAA